MNGFSYMAMTNYPYPTSFLEPMPAWPVNEACKAFDSVDPPSKNEDSKFNQMVDFIFNQFK